MSSSATYRVLMRMGRLHCMWLVGKYIPFVFASPEYYILLCSHYLYKLPGAHELSKVAKERSSQFYLKVEHTTLENSVTLRYVQHTP